MNLIIDKQDLAVKEFENILTICNFIDWESIRPATETQYASVIKQQTHPIFYRATTPAEATMAAIKKNGSAPKQASLFLLYGITACDYLNGDNKTKAIQMRFGVTLQYDTKYLFWKSEAGENKFIKYLDDLLNVFENAKYSIAEVMPEQAIADDNEPNKFVYQRQYSFAKIF
jgi:hypothetical protein